MVGLKRHSSCYCQNGNGKWNGGKVAQCTDSEEIKIKKEVKIEEKKRVKKQKGGRLKDIPPARKGKKPNSCLKLFRPKGKRKKKN